MSEPQRVKRDGERWYKINGNAYPSVTTVTGWSEEKKKAIASWEDSLDDPDLVRNQKGLLGTLVHHRILDPLAMRKLPAPEVDLDLVYDGLEADIETCEMLWDQCSFRVGENPYIEERVYSNEWGYAGTFDMMTNGTVVDLKTSKTAYPSHKMQLAAYFNAVKELSDYPDPEEGAIIVLHPDPENNPKLIPRVHRFDESELTHWFNEFTDLLEKVR